MRIGIVRKPLELAYEEPPLMPEKCGKYFSVLIKQKTVNISVDRPISEEPAYLLGTITDNLPEVLPDNATRRKDLHLTVQTLQTVADDKKHIKNTEYGRRVKIDLSDFRTGF